MLVYILSLVPEDPWNTCWYSRTLHNWVYVCGNDGIDDFGHHTSMGRAWKCLKKGANSQSNKVSR